MYFQIDLDMDPIGVESLLRYFALWGAGLIVAGLISVVPGLRPAGDVFGV